MSDDKTLYSRQNSKEIDEALAWLESLGDSAVTRRSTRRAQPTAFMQLPAWLRQDIQIEMPEPVQSAEKQTDDNLSWLEAIASGSGGVSEEPPTMQWADSVLEQIAEDEATELMSPDYDDFDMDAPTHITMERPAIDTEITTTHVPNSREAIPDEFEPTNIIPELSDEARALVDDEAALEPTSLIFPDSPEQAFDFADILDEPTHLLTDDADAESKEQDFDFADLIDEPTHLLSEDTDVEPNELPHDHVEVFDFTDPIDEPTHLLNEESVAKQTDLPSFDSDETDIIEKADESTSLLPPLPPLFEPIDPFEPTKLITDSQEPLFEPTSFAPPSAEMDEPTHLLQPSDEGDVYDTREVVSEAIDKSAETPTTDNEPISTETAQDDFDDIEPNIIFPDLAEDEPTELYQPTVDESQSIHDTDETTTVENLPDFEPTELYLPNDAELESLVETSPPPHSVMPPEDLFEDIPTELIFDDFAAMAAEQGQPVEKTEIIPSYTDELDSFDFPELDDATEIFAPHRMDSPIEQPIEGLSDYADEPTEPSLVRPELDAALVDATQYFNPQGEQPFNNLFEPTIVSEISIAERWQAIPTELRPRKGRNDTPKVEAEKTDTEPTETISKVLHIADDIPDDPDETIAWLEEMARQQKLGGTIEQVEPDIADAISPVAKSGSIEDELPTILAEPEVVEGEELPSAEIAPRDEPIHVIATDEQLPADFFDAVDEESPTIMAEVGQSADEGMDAFVREVSEVLDDEREPFETLDSEIAEDGEPEEELTDALAWLEELVTGTDSSIDEMTIELNETDVNRLLDSYRPSEFIETTSDLADHPTLITQHPSVNQPNANEAPDDLDAALSWLEGLNFDEESSLLEPPTPAQPMEAPVTMIDYSAAINSARHAFQTQSYAEALVIFEDLLQREDKNATDLVIEDLIDWTSKVQDHAPFYRLLGDAYLQRGDYEKAAWTFRRGLTI